MGSVVATYRMQQLALIGEPREQQGISKVTARKRLQIVERWFRWLEDWGFLADPPKVLLRDFTKIRKGTDSDRLTPQTERLRHYTLEEIRTLYGAADSPRLKAAILYALNTAATQVDAATLEWEMIDLNSRIVLRYRHKTEDKKIISKHRLWRCTLDALAKLSTRRSGLVFTGARGPLVQQHINDAGNIVLYDQLFIDFRGLKRKLKMASDPRSFKHLRKTAANDVERLNQDMPHLTTMFLAHGEKATKKFYADRHYDQLNLAIDRLGEYYGLGPV